MTAANAYRIDSGLLRGKMGNHYPQKNSFYIPSLIISVSVFSLNARLGRKFQLQKGVGDVILLVSVCFAPVRLKIGVTNAEGSFLVNARDDTFSTPGVCFHRQAARLQGDPIPVEQGIELVEGESRRAPGADEEQVALCKARLNRGDVDGLKQLRLEQFADPCDLMAWQSRIGVGQKPVGRKVARVGIDRFPSFHQGELLKAQIAVNSREACASCSQV